VKWFNQLVHFLETLTHKLGVKPEDQRDITTYSYWYKQVFHFIGGFIIIGSVCLINWVVAVFALILLAAYQCYNEAQDVEYKQPIHKAVVDGLAWCSGGVFSIWLISFLLG